MLNYSPGEALLPTSVSSLHIWPCFQYEEELAVPDTSCGLVSLQSHLGVFLSLPPSSLPGMENQTGQEEFKDEGG